MPLSLAIATYSEPSTSIIDARTSRYRYGTMIITRVATGRINLLGDANGLTPGGIRATAGNSCSTEVANRITSVIATTKSGSADITIAPSSSSPSAGPRRTAVTAPSTKDSGTTMI